MRKNWSVFLGTLGPVGLMKKAPGTWGSVVGFCFWGILFTYLPLWLFIAICLVSIVISIPICTKAACILEEKDPSCIVLDEFVAVPFCYLPLVSAPIIAPQFCAMLLIGFILFRFFDIVKPLGISKLQRIPGGLGIVLDDVAAGLATWGMIVLLQVVCC